MGIFSCACILPRNNGCRFGRFKNLALDSAEVHRHAKNTWHSLRLKKFGGGSSAREKYAVCSDAEKFGGGSSAREKYVAQFEAEKFGGGSTACEKYVAQFEAEKFGGGSTACEKYVAQFEAEKFS